MNIYPSFEEESIIGKCESDITTFKNQFHYQDQDDYLLNIANDYETFRTHINVIKTKINRVINQQININDPSDLTNFNYIDSIARLNDENKKRLWLLRTQLFYQLLIIATKMMNDRTIFDNFYLNYNNANYKYSRIFNENVSKNLKYYKMGIFGSLTPTSDIDVGIIYTGYIVDNGLAYIVKIVEDLFILFTGCNTLQFDIELYADMMTIPNENGHDLFYLDTTSFQPVHFFKILPYVEASILRNYVTANIHDSNPDIKKIISNFNYQNFFDRVTSYSIYPDSVSGLIQNVRDIPPSFLNFFKASKPANSFIKVTDECINIVTEYMASPYDDAREKYYGYVNQAEKLVHKERLKYMTKQELTLTTDDIVEIMSAIAKSLIFRAESYTCAPTVMHVVRVLQANSDRIDDFKRETETPGYCPIKIQERSTRATRAFCNIGNYGYLISILEQYGYIYRFFITYCSSSPHQDISKCEKKITKYTTRVQDAIARINIIPPNQHQVNYDDTKQKYVTEQYPQHRMMVSQGGRRRRITKHLKKNKRSKRRRSKRRHHFTPLKK